MAGLGILILILIAFGIISISCFALAVINFIRTLKGQNKKILTIIFLGIGTFLAIIPLYFFVGKIILIPAISILLIIDFIMMLVLVLNK